MELSDTEEQQELRRTVRRFLDASSPESAVREQTESETGYDAEVWRQMADQLGLQSLIIPEALGGQGFGFVELAVVLEEMGRSLFGAPYFSTVVLATNLLLRSGDEEAMRRWLPDIAQGTTIATVAVTEPNGRWDRSGIEATATPAAGSHRLNGSKRFVLDGQVADVVFVAATTAQGPSLFAVPAGAPGLHVTPLSTMDLTRRQAALELDEVEGTLVGEEGAGWDVLAAVLDLAAVGLAAEQVGGAEAVMHLAVEHAKVREQFGRPIGSFQAIKHTCADMLIEVESARSAAGYAAWCAAEAPSELPAAASLAKATCSEAYFRNASEAIQVLGGIGFTWEHPAHLYFRRAASSQLLFGDPTHHRRLLADRIGL